MKRSTTQFHPTLRIITAAAALLMWGITAFAAPPPIRILPVGDSITYGSGGAGGYRWPLYQMLTNAGYNPKFVGTQNGNAAVGQTEVWHEGHGGWTIGGIDGIMASVFGAIEDPDVLILMIGTNDFGTGAGATNRLDALIGKIVTNRPYCKLVVANLTVRGEPQNSNIQTNYNNSVPGIVSNHAARGEQVYFTDMYSSVPLSDMPDNLHPNTNGYIKMATNWNARIQELFSPMGSTNAPAVVRATGVKGFTNVVVTFSKPVADSASNTANYSLSGGLSVLGAVLSTSTYRDVMLTTTTQAMLSNYTVTATGIVDRTAASTPISTNNFATFLSGATNYGTGPVTTSGVFTNVPEVAGWQLVYSINLPATATFNPAVTYDVDLRSFASNFTRVGYYLELQTNVSSKIDFAWVSFDPVTNKVNAIGIPTVSSGGIFQMPVTNMNVLCTVTTVVNGTGLSGGNIEFWPGDYAQSNAANVANASSSAFDWGDIRTGGGNYGSMQVHNHDAFQTIFAFNSWGGVGGTADLGIGNRPGVTDADWTFAHNAGNYVVKRLQVLVQLVSNNPPMVASTVGQTGWTNVIITFSTPVADDATNLSNYALSGLSILGATLDPATKAFVTLTTSTQAPLTTYTGTVSNVRDRTTNAFVIATNTPISFRSLATTDVFGNVQVATNFSLVYSLNIPTAAAFNLGSGVPYDVDLHSYVGPYNRIAYYLALQPSNGTLNYVWVEIDPFDSNPARIGVPANPNGPVFQQNVTNMTVLSSMAGIVTGTNIATGNMEFWPWDYTAANAKSVPNASATAYDWGDTAGSSGGHGSMQIHNYGANLGATTGQTLFAFDNWGAAAGGTTALGIGSQTTNNPDWTFAANTTGYVVKTLQVFVLPVSNPAPTLVSAVGQIGWSNVVLQFSKPLADSSAVLTNFSLSGGLTVLGAVLDATNKTRITLTTSAQTPLTLYTVTVNGIVDRTGDALALAPNTQAAFMSAPYRGVYNNVPEVGNYTLVYQLNATNAGNFNASGAPYGIDNHFGIGGFSRIAYYIELQKAGSPPNFLWVSMDPFTTDAGKIGVPTTPSGAFFQQPVTNMTVISSAAGVTIGTNMSGGNIEFWPNAYATTNSASVPGASGTTFDWGDQPTTGNFGSMQIHNGAAGQVLFAMNNWAGGTGFIDLGIGNNTGNTNSDWTSMNNAGSYTSRVIQIYVLPTVDTNAPTIVSATVSPDRRQVIVTFSEGIADASASVANFSIDNGIVIGTATMGINSRQVTLAVSNLTGGTTYTLTVNNVRDRSANANVIAPNSTVVITTASPLSQILANAPESADYQLVEVLNIPAVATNWNVSGTPYATDYRNLIGPFSRVAYYMELATNNGGPTNWVWVSMDAFTKDVNKVGVPDMALAGGPIIQQRLSNLTVVSSMTNVVAVTNAAGGNIEFWPFNYGGGNAIGIPGASVSALDFGDQVSPTFGTTGHACMQIHNYAASQTVFAINRWGGNGNVVELGIGNDPNIMRGSYSPDWTFATNGPNYSFKNLYVLVKPFIDTNGPLVSRVQGTPDLGKVLVSFNQPVGDSSANVTNFSIAGLTVNSATLSANMHDVLLGTSAQTPLASYVVTISNIRDRTAGNTLMAASIVSNFTAFSAARINALVPESTNYSLIYGLTLPTAVPNYSTNGITYDIDMRPIVTQNFNRVAYFMELATNGGATSWVYVSCATFDTNINRIAVPFLGSGAGYQTKLATATVYASEATFTTGTNLSTLNLEFYPFNYDSTLTNVATGGSGTNYDWNDTYNVGTQYGSMQIHNYGASNVLFAFNRWSSGQTGFCDIGIGNFPDNVTNTDWKLTQSATNYVTKNLYILIRPTNAVSVVVNTSVIAPTFVSHPASRTNYTGSAAILAGLAGGTAPITYQWRKGTNTIASQTNSWLTFASLLLTDAGSYSVTASNSAGVVTSLVAVLSVTNPPPATGYDAWAGRITNGLTNYNDSAASDGYPNLLKYATGSNPTNSDNLARMNATRTDDIFSFRFNRDTNTTDIRLIVEGAYTTTNDATWNGIATNIAGNWGGATNVIENTATNPASVTVSDPAGPSTNRFLRLRITRP